MFSLIESSEKQTKRQESRRGQFMNWSGKGGQERVMNLTILCYMHVSKCQDEPHYYVQLIYANKNTLHAKKMYSFPFNFCLVFNILSLY
jgi:hypothetical protein